MQATMEAHAPATGFFRLTIFWRQCCCPKDSPKESFVTFGENLFDNGLCLPSGSNLTGEDLERAVDNILSV